MKKTIEEDNRINEEDNRGRQQRAEDNRVEAKRARALHGTPRHRKSLLRLICSGDTSGVRRYGGTKDSCKAADTHTSSGSVEADTDFTSLRYTLSFLLLFTVCYLPQTQKLLRHDLAAWLTQWVKHA